MTAPDVPGVGTGLRAGVRRWITEQTQMLPERRTEAAHGKAELLIELHRFLAANPEPTPTGLVEAAFAVLMAHQRIPTYDGTGGQRCVGCDNLAGEMDGSNSPRHTQHLAAHVAAEVSAWVRGQREAVNREPKAWLCQHDGSVHRRGIYHPGDKPLVTADAAIAALVGEA